MRLEALSRCLNDGDQPAHPKSFALPVESVRRHAGHRAVPLFLAFPKQIQL